MGASDLLLLLLLGITVVLLVGSGGLLSPDTTGATTTEWRGESKVNVLLGVETDNERWDIDDLLADSDVSLSDQDTGVVNRLGESLPINTRPEQQ